MRKEVYKRKAKKSFTRIKKHQKLVSNTENVPEFNASKEYQSFRFKALYQRRGFKAFVTVLSLLIIAFFVWLYVIIPYTFDKGKAAFETENILSYFKESKFDKIGGFMAARRDKLDRIETPFFQGGLVIYLRSTDYKSDSEFGKTYIGIDGGERAEVHGDGLTILSKDGTRTHKNDWRSRISVNNINDIHHSIFEYLKTDPIELDEILREVVKQRLEVSSSDTSSVISFYHYYGSYSVHFASKPDTSKTLIREIGPGVFLTERY